MGEKRGILVEQVRPEEGEDVTETLKIADIAVVFNFNDKSCQLHFSDPVLAEEVSCFNGFEHRNHHVWIGRTNFPMLVRELAKHFEVENLSVRSL